ncbi:MAG: hypothetical protein ACREMB_01925 [Candidatus Rokuibacteriota bacterium]
MSLPRSAARGPLHRGLVAALLALALAGCAARSRPVSAYGTAYEPAAGERAAVARDVLNVVATPFYVVFKAAVCATTLVLAVPAAAVVSVTDPASESWQRQNLDEGVAENCGPPWVLF